MSPTRPRHRLWPADRGRLNSAISVGADEPPLVTPRRLRGPVALTGRTRRRFLTWGSASTVTCLALCVVAAHHPQLLDQWDHVLALGPDWWRRSASWLEHPLVWVSSAFGTVASAIATVVVAGLLLYWKQGRAAAYVVLTIAGTSLVTAGLKQYVGLA